MQSRASCLVKHFTVLIEQCCILTVNFSCIINNFTSPLTVPGDASAERACKNFMHFDLANYFSHYKMTCNI